MLPSALAFVDIETTGTNPVSGRIIEIGILRVENGKLVKTFQTLINPQMYVDPFIENLTGITQEGLLIAPTFDEVKDEIITLLEGVAFVAHNVRFDYAFVRNELRRYGVSYTAKQICTVKLSRLLYPRFQKHNLDSLIERFNFICERRHRAFDDAKVLWDFFQKAQIDMGLEKFAQAIDRVLKRPSVPLAITQDMLDTLPETPGVYIFYGDDGAPLYIGKSVNIRDRVLSHFSSDHLSSTDMKISQQIKSIETIPTAGELGALFLESTLIKQHQPLFNRVLRYAHKLIALRKIQTPDGYLTVEAVDAHSVDVQGLENIIGIFKSRKQVKDFLYMLSKEYGLCHKLLGLEKGKGCCFSYHLGQCFGACLGNISALKYNLKFDEAFFKHRIKPWPFAGPVVIKEKGESEEHFVVDKWCLVGSMKSDADLENLQKEYAFDFDTYKILLRYLKSQRKLSNIDPFILLQSEVQLAS